MFMGLNINDQEIQQLGEVMTRALSAKPAQMLRDVSGNVGVTTGLGLTGISMESPAKLLAPRPTPLRNMIPRRTVGGVNTTYRQITDINTAKTWGSVPEAERNSVQQFDESEKTISFHSYGIDGLLTQEALFGGKSSINPSIDFNPQSTASLANLLEAMFLEELLILGGNSVALGAPATPTAAAVQPATATGSLTASTAYYFRVSALTEKGYYQGATGRVSSTNAPGETTPSSQLTVTTAAGGQPGDTSVKIEWAAKLGAVAYNVYAHSTTTVIYHSTVYVNNATINALTSSTHVVNTADLTDPAVDTLAGKTNTQFDGLISWLSKSANSYVHSLAGASLTGDNTTGVAELDDMFLDMWTNYKVSPDLIIVSGAQKRKFDRIILGSSTPGMNVYLTAGQTNITGGMTAGQVVNRYYANKVIPTLVHPNLPPGIILAPVFQLGEYYPGSNIANNFEMRLAFEYARTEFARVKRQDEFGTYAAGALAMFATFGGGILTEVGTA